VLWGIVFFRSRNASFGREICAIGKIRCRSEVPIFRQGGVSSKMMTTDDFRARAHELIADLDAATNEMMNLISEHQLSGPEWERVSQWQHEAYERWMSYLNEQTYADPGDHNASR
jgi:hypothetical protein